MDVYERIMLYATILYQRALERLEAGRLQRAESLAAAAAGAAGFVEGDTESPDEMRSRATDLMKAAEGLLSAIWKAQTEGYGKTFLSGSQKRSSAFEHEASLFTAELRDAMKEVGS
jgi:hypothetical protein